MQDTLKGHVRDWTAFQLHCARLMPSQKPFVDNVLVGWLRNRTDRLVIVSGGPGAGKTHTVVQTLDHFKFETLKMAPTARIAHKIGGKTIHSTLKLAWGSGTPLNKLEKELAMSQNIQECIAQSELLMQEFKYLPRPDVVVVDEIGMVPFWLTHWIVQYFFRKNHNTLIVLMGDSRQLKPVRSQYNVFGVDLKMTNAVWIDMTDSLRFTDEYKAVVDTLKTYIDADDTAGLFAYVADTYPIVEEVDADTLNRCRRAMAYRNATVDSYNAHYISKFPGRRVRVYPLDLSTGQVDRSSHIDLKMGCDVLVTENGCSVVTNGTPLVFDRYDADADALECHYPSRQEDAVVVSRNNRGFFPIVPGFAGTVHKFQGDTIDDNGVVFNFDGCTDPNLIYTALSRVRSLRQVLAVKL